jgi:hypothetical protein
VAVNLEIYLVLNTFLCRLAVYANQGKLEKVKNWADKKEQASEAKRAEDEVRVRSEMKWNDWWSLAGALNCFTLAQLSIICVSKRHKNKCYCHQCPSDDFHHREESEVKKKNL